MKNLFLIVLLCSVFTPGAHAHVAETAEAVSDMVIEKLNDRLASKTYKMGRICYKSKSSCWDEARTMRILANSKVSIKAYCHRKVQKNLNDDCYGNDWFLHTEIRILEP